MLIKQQQKDKLTKRQKNTYTKRQKERKISNKEKESRTDPKRCVNVALYSSCHLKFLLEDMTNMKRPHLKKKHEEIFSI